jgi:hypothetical protein
MMKSRLSKRTLIKTLEESRNLYFGTKHRLKLVIEVQVLEAAIE